MITIGYIVIVPEPEHWTDCINGNQKEVRRSVRARMITIGYIVIVPEYSNLPYG